MQRLRLEGLVRWEDRYIPNEEIGIYFTAADMLVAPYLSDSQSAVVSLGLRFGIPLVVTPSIAARLSVQPGRMRTVPPADATALAAAITSLGQEGTDHEPVTLHSQDSWTGTVLLIESLTAGILQAGHEFSATLGVPGL